MVYVTGLQLSYHSLWENDFYVISRKSFAIKPKWIVGVARSQHMAIEFLYLTNVG
jgi:hypothetical protein